MSYRSIILAAPVSLAILLGGCTGTAPDLAGFITAVQQAVTTACGAARIIIPTAKTIADILASGDATVKTVEGIVDVIVAAVCPESTHAKAKPTSKLPGISIEIIKIPGQ